MKLPGTLVSAVLAMLLVAACGGGSNTPQHTIDTVQWQKDLDEFDVRVTDWDRYRGVFEEECASKDFSMFIAVSLDNGEGRDQIRTDFKNACPDRHDVQQAFDDLDSTNAVCSIPKNLRSESQRQIGEAMGC